MARLSKPVDPADHVLGPDDAPVILVEYGDFQCPYCGAAAPILKQIIKQMGDRLQFVFRHFPLTESHEYAEIAAEASEAAAAQGKFWQMHDTLYSHQDDLDVEHLYEFAQMIDLEMDRFYSDLKNHTYEERVQSDFRSGVRSGVNGTPTLYINGQRYDGPVDKRVLMQALQEAEETAQA